MSHQRHAKGWIYVFVLLNLGFSALGAILRVGNPLQWIDSKPHLNSVRLSGVEQFVQHYERCKGVELPLFVWGDEIEYGVFARDRRGHLDLSLNATRIRESLTKLEKRCVDLPIGCEWQPEYGSWMVEAVPRNPYGSYVSDLMNVEKSMPLRRKRLHFALMDHEVAPTMSTFPMLGVDGYPHGEGSRGPVANSQYLNDNVINPHPRFAALTRNIRKRRGENVSIKVGREDKQGEIDMDAMAFGMGCCCLQVTMQCESESESRFLHDQLLVLGPLLQALSASTPIFKGQLADTDTRWEVISQAVDDRTPNERKNERKNEEIKNHQKPTFTTKRVEKETSKVEISTFDTSKKSIFDILQAHSEPSITSQTSTEKSVECQLDVSMAGYGVKSLSRSRYSSSCLYLHQPQSLTDLNRLLSLNNLPVEHDESVFLNLIKSGKVDVPLALHLSHMFTRDPLVIFDDAVTLDNSKSLDHFESIQSTNWRSMRWKPPSLRVGLEAQRRRKDTYLGDKKTEKIEVKTEGKFDGNLEENTRKNEENMEEKVDMESGDDRSMNDYLLDFDHNILVEDRVDHDSIAFDGFPSKPQQQLPVKEEDLQVFGPGWRIEFRPLEVQLTDFENAAFAVFVILISRALVAHGRTGDSIIMPMVLVEENMKRAQKKDAVLNEKFFIRRNTFSSFTTATNTAVSTSSGSDCASCESTSKASTINSDSNTKGLFTIPDINDIDIVELSLDHIINGEPPNSINRFPGLIPVAMEYMKSLGCDDTSMVSNGLAPYLKLLQHRANGSLPTTARYIRDYVKNHPEYVKQTQQQQIQLTTHATHTTDPIVSIADLAPAINDDLLLHCEDIGMGRIHTPFLYGDFKPIENLDLIDEEDLMFSNFTCFVKPVKTPFLDLAEMSMLDGVEEEVVSQPKGLVGAVKEMLMKPWRRVNRSKEEQIKL